MDDGAGLALERDVVAVAVVVGHGQPDLVAGHRVLGEQAGVLQLLDVDRIEIGLAGFQVGDGGAALGAGQRHQVLGFAVVGDERTFDVTVAVHFQAGIGELLQVHRIGIGSAGSDIAQGHAAAAVALQGDAGMAGRVVVHDRIGNRIVAAAGDILDGIVQLADVDGVGARGPRRQVGDLALLSLGAHRYAVVAVGYGPGAERDGVRGVGVRTGADGHGAQGAGLGVVGAVAETLRLEVAVALRGQHSDLAELGDVDGVGFLHARLDVGDLPLVAVGADRNGIGTVRHGLGAERHTVAPGSGSLVAHGGTVGRQRGGIVAERQGTVCGRRRARADAYAPVAAGARIRARCDCAVTAGLSPRAKRGGGLADGLGLRTDGGGVLRAGVCLQAESRGAVSDRMGAIADRGGCVPEVGIPAPARRRALRDGTGADGHVAGIPGLRRLDGTRTGIETGPDLDQLIACGRRLRAPRRQHQSACGEPGGAAAPDGRAATLAFAAPGRDFGGHGPSVLGFAPDDLV